MRGAAGTLLFALVTLLAAGAGAQAENVIATLSTKVVEIRSNFVGTEIVLFGSIERDEATVGRAHGYDVVVEVAGPDRDIVVWRKERVAGIWVNGAGVEYKDAPSYYAVLSNRALGDIAGKAVLKRKGIGELQTASDRLIPSKQQFRCP